MAVFPRWLTRFWPNGRRCRRRPPLIRFLDQSPGSARVQGADNSEDLPPPPAQLSLAQISCREAVLQWSPGICAPAMR